MSTKKTLLFLFRITSYKKEKTVELLILRLILHLNTIFNLIHHLYTHLIQRFVLIVRLEKAGLSEALKRLT